jgi:transcriptional regulator with PAS, ATPase and Fis domain
MNDYKKLLERFFLLLSSISYPAFISDPNGRIIRMNIPLKRIVEKVNIKITDLDVDKILKINDFNIKFKKEHLSTDGIPVLKFKSQRLMHISILTEDDLYVGSLMVIINKKHQYPLLSEFYSVSKLDILDNGKAGNSKNNLKSRKLKDVLNSIEREFIQLTLNETNNRSEAIKLLGVSRRTFYYKIRKYKLL